MALGSWQGLYNAVITGLMAERKEQELLLLTALATHCDPFGFCFPGRARLMAMRHCAEKKLEQRLAFLQERGYITMTETWNPRHHQYEPDYQVSPRALYVRPEIQEYCEAVFEGVQERDFGLEKNFLVSLSSTKDSQPEALPESETRRSKPESGTSPINRNHNQLRPRTQTDAQGSTMRNGAKPANSDSNQQRRPAQHSKDNPQAGGPVDFSALLSPDVDDDRMVSEIVHVVSTTKHQASAAVVNYTRESIIHWLEVTARRRQKGEIARPGGFFFRMLEKHGQLLRTPGPNGQYDDWDQNSEPQEF